MSDREVCKPHPQNPGRNRLAGQPNWAIPFDGQDATVLLQPADCSGVNRGGEAIEGVLVEEARLQSELFDQAVQVHPRPKGDDLGSRRPVRQDHARAGGDSQRSALS